MSAIAGIFNLDAPVTGGASDALVRAAGADAPGAWRAEGRAALANGSAHGVLRVDAAGRMLLADARIDNASDLRRILGSLPGAPCVGNRVELDADLILAAYARWGERCVDHLVGDFSFALWDPARQSLFCARDPMGVRPFYYAESDDRFSFASDMRTLLSLPGVQRDVDSERVAHFLLNTDVGREATFYRGIRRLPAGHTLVRTPANRSLRRYWDLESIGELRLGGDDEYASAFRELFQQAVAARVTDDGSTAATLSGGLDSSAIACMARSLIDAGTPLHTISLIFPDLPASDLRLIDERRFIATVTAREGISAHMVHGDRSSPLRDVRSTVGLLEEPFAAPNLYLHLAMYEAAAAAGCTVFLDGFDGDSVVSHGIARLDDLLAAGDWPGYERETHAFASRRGISPARVAGSYGLPRLDWLAATGRWTDWSRTARALHRSFGISRRDLVVEHGLRATRVGRRLLPPERTIADRIVRATSRDVDASPAAQPPSARAAHVAGLMQTAYQDTLELAFHCSRSFGLDARFPFFDRRLIEFCVSLPAEQKLADGWSRRVMRNALRGVLPEEIRLRTDKSNLLPALHRGIREDDASLLRALDFTRIDEFVHVDRLRDMREEYLDSTDVASSDADPLLLLRCAALAVWMEDRPSAQETGALSSSSAAQQLVAETR